MRIKTLAAACWLGFVWTMPLWGQAEDGRLSERARATLDYLESMDGKGTLVGYNVYPHTPDVYEQTGKRAAMIGRDLRWLGDAEEIIRLVKERGCLLTLHWHWSFADDSAWGRRREQPVSLERLLELGTVENEQLIRELAWAADTLELFAEADVPVLWRPLHEIDGGWFWWTDREKPENTARLWRAMFDYFVEERGLDNLIWVYSAGVGDKSVEYRKRFYPGSEYVDVSGIDVYGVDFRESDAKYWSYYRTMQQVSPGKLLALGEGDALPDPALMASGELPAWTYALPWWGTPSARRPVDWARYSVRHPFMVTLEDVPTLGLESLPPVVGLLEPADDGSASYAAGEMVSVTGEAFGRDGSEARVTLFADEKPIAEFAGDGEFAFEWMSPHTGYKTLRAVAVDEEGRRTVSNTIRVVAGMENLALGSVPRASSMVDGSPPSQAVDGDFHTEWRAKPDDPQWLLVDLKKERELGEAVVIWGFRSNGEDFRLELASENPEEPDSWREAFRREGRPYQSWKAEDRIGLAGERARYLRLTIESRAGEWGGHGVPVAELLVFGK